MYSIHHRHGDRYEDWNLYTIILFVSPVANAGFLLNNSEIDDIADALSGEPSFAEGGHDAKIGFWMIRLFSMGWPVKDKDVRATWDIDPNQDTDGDGIPDVDDEDIDGDGVRNRKDGSPYGSSKQLKAPDRDGVPDDIDGFPKDPGRTFITNSALRLEKKMNRAMWR